MNNMNSRKQQLVEQLSKVLKSNLWTRIFSWKQIWKALTQLKEQLVLLLDNNEDLQSANEQLSTEKADAKESLARKEEELRIIKEEQRIKEEKLKSLEAAGYKNQQLQSELNTFKQEENSRTAVHDLAIKQLEKTQLAITAAEERRVEKEEEAQRYKLEQLRKTWKLHEDSVKAQLKLLCEQHGIRYTEKFPYEGKAPDNVIQIVNDHIIFDAKAPANENLDNFPTYIKSQVAKLGKYAKFDSVHRHLYLVIPSNCAEIVIQKTYADSNYTVHVITLDSLETILLALKKLEEYEYTEKLSPEDREGIARMLSGLLSYGKRTVQVNTFFNEWFLRFIKENTGRLPADILQAAEQLELGTRINPGNQAANKLIDAEHENTKNEAVKTIAFNQEELNKIDHVEIKEVNNE